MASYERRLAHELSHVAQCELMWGALSDGGGLLVLLILKLFLSRKFLPSLLVEVASDSKQSFLWKYFSLFHTL